MNKKLTQWMVVWLSATIGSLLVASTVHAQTLATEPLLNRSLPVKPNLVFNMDTSGSMGWACVYLPHVVTFLTQDYPAADIPGISADCLTSTDRRQQSVDHNALTYDPKKRYDPGFDNNGVRFAPPAVPATFTTQNIYFVNPGLVPANMTKAQQIDTANYNVVSVRTGGFCTVAGTCSSPSATNPLGTKNPARTDCAGTVCTLAEEKRNITNWRAYHDTRLDAAKAGVGTAFAEQPDAFRLSWMTIADTAPVATIADYGLVSGTNSTKKSFYTWLNSRSASGGTPLRAALDSVGKYYEGTADSGPWGNRPWQSTSDEGKSTQLSCRRSYALLMTDGLWTGTTAPTSVSGKDSDGKTGTQVTGSTQAGATVSFTYTPADKTSPRNRGKSDLSSGAAGFQATLADIAHHYWVRDLRSDLTNNVKMSDPAVDPFWQNMTTFTVSFGAGGTMTNSQLDAARAGTGNWVQPVAEQASTIDDLIHAAHNSGGDFLAVTDANSFATKLSDALAKITAQKDSQAGVAASGPALVAGVTKFVTGFVSGQWWGNISSINLSLTGASTGTKWEVVKTDAKGDPVVPNVSTIPSFNARNIVTWKDNTNKAVEFTWANATAGLKATSTASNPTKLTNTMSESEFNYLRGERTNETGGGGTDAFRVRRAVMGDIVNSTPTLIRNVRDPGYGGLGLAGYVAYLEAKKSRSQGVVLVGANDGMLHAFRESDGVELWAYVPQMVLGKLHNLSRKSYTHQFFVDGPVTEADAYLNGGWKNLAVGALGLGGKAVYAVQFDTADPTASLSTSSVRWESNASATAFAELGHVLAPIQTGVMMDNRWVGIFGNGYDSASCRSSLFIVNLDDGSLIKKIDAENGPTGSLCAGANKNGLGGVKLVYNTDKKIIGAYAGDLQGNVWKFNLEGASSTSWALGNGGAPLFQAKSSTGAAQPITAPPEVMKRVDIAAHSPSYMVIVATGKLHEVEDQAKTDSQTIYGLWDKNGFSSTTNIAITSRSLLVPVETSVSPTVSRTVATDITTTSAGFTSFYSSVPSRTVDWAVDRGWVLDMTIKAGQRSITPAEILGDVVRVDTLVPSDPKPSCDLSSASGYSYFVEPLTGACKKQTTFDTNGDGKINEDDSTSCVVALPADGLDAVFTRQTGDGTGFDDKDVVVTLEGVNSFETARVASKPPPIPESKGVTRRIWRQIYLP